MERSLEASSLATHAAAEADAVAGRRKLPKTPANVNQAELLIEFAVDVERQELAATLVAARGVVVTTYAFVMVHMLPGGQ